MVAYVSGRTVRETWAVVHPQAVGLGMSMELALLLWQLRHVLDQDRTRCQLLDLKGSSGLMSASPAPA